MKNDKKATVTEVGHTLKANVTSMPCGAEADSRQRAGGEQLDIFGGKSYADFVDEWLDESWGSVGASMFHATCSALPKHNTRSNRIS